MSLGHGASIVKTGLVFHYDMGNTAKSWKGRPTTNLSNQTPYAFNGLTLTYVGMEGGWAKYSIFGT